MWRKCHHDLSLPTLWLESVRHFYYNTFAGTLENSVGEAEPSPRFSTRLTEMCICWDVKATSRKIRKPSQQNLCPWPYFISFT